MPKITVDRNKCIGCGTCIALAPKIFSLDKDGKAIVISETADTKENIKSTADACPVRAINYQE